MSFEQNQNFITGPRICIPVEEVCQAGQEGLPRYVTDAEDSNIPEELHPLGAAIELQVTSDQSFGRNSGLKDPYMERCFRLFEKPFSNPSMAFYTLAYCEAITRVKSLIKLATSETDEVDLVRVPDEVFEPFIARYSQKFDIPERIILGDPSILPISPSELESVIDMVTRRRFYRERLYVSETIIKNARNQTELSVGIPAAIEQRATLTEGNTLEQVLFRLRQLVTRALTTDDLAQAREQVNNYFQNPQKVSRIKLLARSQARS